MLFVSQLLKKQDDPGRLFWLTFTVLGLAVAISLLVWMWSQIRAWYWDDDDPAADAGDFLTALRDSTRQGDVSDEEFRSIQSRLASRLQGHGPTSPPNDTSLQSLEQANSLQSADSTESGSGQSEGTETRSVSEPDKA